MKTRLTLIHCMLVAMLALLPSAAIAQDTDDDKLSYVITGEVRDQATGKRLENVNVTAPQRHLSTVTNADGVFTLKTVTRPSHITISHVGYQTQRVALNATHGKIKVKLVPASVQLMDVIVHYQDPHLILSEAMRRIQQNYSQRPELLTCFYRETAKKRNKFIHVSEAVVDLYKSPYTFLAGTERDRAAIVKARRIVSRHRGDTLGMKVLGGPTEIIFLDIVKNRDFILNENELKLYALKMEVPVSIGDRMHYVIAIDPNTTTEYALYHGRFYIDMETLAISRAELSLDMQDKDKATRLMLIKKPSGVRFKPKELSFFINFRTDNDTTRISYIRSTYRFDCDWKRRLFSTGFTAVNEMVVTDWHESVKNPIPRKASFGQRDSFAEMVGDFSDPDFWRDYNIIEPSESLENAINKLKKK